MTVFCLCCCGFLGCLRFLLGRRRSFPRPLLASFCRWPFLSSPAALPFCRCCVGFAALCRLALHFLVAYPCHHSPLQPPFAMHDPFGFFEPCFFAYSLFLEIFPKDNEGPLFSTPFAMSKLCNGSANESVSEPDGYKTKWNDCHEEERTWDVITGIELNFKEVRRAGMT